MPLGRSRVNNNVDYKNSDIGIWTSNDICLLFSTTKIETGANRGLMR